MKTLTAKEQMVYDVLLEVADLSKPSEFEDGKYWHEVSLGALHSCLWHKEVRLNDSPGMLNRSMRSALNGLVKKGLYKKHPDPFWKDYNGSVSLND